MQRKDGTDTRRYKHIFLDAEGTLYVPKDGRSRWEFWADPSPELAEEFFELDSGVEDALRRIRRKAHTLGLVSWNSEPVLTALLRKFKLSEYFDCVLINGDKGKNIEKYLEKNGLRKEDAIMVGDMPNLDLYPLRRAGIDAILVDRDYNWYVKAEKIRGVSELPGWLRIAELADRIEKERVRNSTLDEFVSGEPQNAHQTKSLIASAGS
jgi:phosphoglycolate phosphatase-like HAD superfamily hydrolase